MKAVRAILGVITAFLFLAIAGMAYLVTYLDRHRDLVELGAGEVLGRAVRIEEGIEAHWSLLPSIDLAGLRVANPEWAGGEDFVRAERVVVQFDLKAMLQGRLVVRQVTVRRAEILLETAANGQKNWVLGDGGSGGVLSRIDVIDAENVRFRYRAASGAEHVVEITRCVLHGLVSEEIGIDGEFSYRDLPLAFSATSPAHGEAAPAARSFSGRLAMGDVVAEFSGHATPSYEIADLAIGLKGEELDLARILTATGKPAQIRGELRQIAAQFNTSGDTPQTLLRNLGGVLDFGSANVALPSEGREKATRVILRKTSFSVIPGEPITLSTTAMYDDEVIKVELSGGTLTQLLSEGEDSWQSLGIKAQGQVNEQPLKIEGRLGPLSAVLAGQDLDADLTLQSPGLAMQLDGTLARLSGLDGSRLAIEASGTSLSVLQPWLGVDVIDTEPFTLAARVETSDHGLQMTGLKAKIGETALSGGLTLTLDQRLRIEGKLASPSLTLFPVFGQVEELVEGKKPFLEQELSPDALQKLDGRLLLEVDRLQVGELVAKHVQFDATLDRQNLKVAMTAADNRLKADISLEPQTKGWRLAVDHQGKLDLGWLIDRNEEADGRSEAPVALDMRLSGIGNSLGSMLESSEGSFQLQVGTGWLSKKASAYLPLGSVLLTLLNSLNPDGKAGPSPLECAVVQFDVADGIATSTKGIAVRTDKVNVLGGGAVKVRTGEIDLQFKTARRKGLGLNVLGVAENFIHLRGTLDKPHAELNVGGFLTHGGAAWATGGVSLLYDVFARRLTGFSNPCETVLAAGKGSQ